MRERSSLKLLPVLLLVAGLALAPAASQAEVIFEDGFESGDVTTGGWTYSGALTVDSTAYSGNYAARIDDTGYLLKIVDTTGYESVTLQFAWYTYAYDSGEYLDAFWSTDGSTWNTIDSHQSGWEFNEVPLPAGAANQPTLYIAFDSNANGYYERFRIDDVAVIGTGGANSPPEFITDPFTASSATVDTPYSDSIAGSAVDPDDDAITYTKVSGPAWLNIASDGTLSGTPLAGDLNLNEFTVEADDGIAGIDTATLRIFVNAQAGQQETIFEDGFESGDVSTGGWTYSGDLTVDGTSYSGNYAARIDDTGYLQKIVDTTGYHSITLDYARYTYAYDSGEYLYVEWSIDGNNWNPIETYQAGWAFNEGVELGAGAAQQSTLFIRFRSNANGYYERFRIDDVAVIGTTGEPPPNRPPQFVADPFSTPDAAVDSAYSASIAGSATDPDPGDTITYSKLSGPGWLSIASDGALSGTPGSGDVGGNSFLVEAFDGEYTDEATLNITVSEDPGPGPSCLPQVTDYRGDGPFNYTTDDISVGSDNVNVWIPTGLPENCRVPIVHLANGTGASCSDYNSALTHFASHGFITACYEDTQTGQGTQAIDAINAVLSEYGGIAAAKYGFTGHSQGGGGAILGVYRAEQQWGSAAEYAGLGIEPAHGYGDSPSNWASLYGQIYSPVSMFNGSSDLLVSASWVRDGYEALPDTLEKAWYEAQGAGHIPPPNADAGEMGVAWFRWQLLGDSDACEYFKAMPDSSDWDLQEIDNLSPCD